MMMMLEKFYFGKIQFFSLSLLSIVQCYQCMYHANEMTFISTLKNSILLCGKLSVDGEFQCAIKMSKKLLTLHRSKCGNSVQCKEFQSKRNNLQSITFLIEFAIIQFHAFSKAFSILNCKRCEMRKMKRLFSFYILALCCYVIRGELRSDMNEFFFTNIL